uniref:Uncharacterized protein n=1 Tax=Meloidogyne hapla TaxID=6305 RepID=A0A1I8BSZ8_MELHA
MFLITIQINNYGAEGYGRVKIDSPQHLHVAMEIVLFGQIFAVDVIKNGAKKRGEQKFN